MRIEDLDHPRDKPGAASQAIDDLRWLGFDWDGFSVQSERRAVYRDAIETLRGKGLAYPCVCSRSDVEAAQSAPHDGEQLFYPGTCRGRFATWGDAQRFLDARAEGGRRRLPCWRFRVGPGTRVAFTDAFAGEFSQDVSATLGDFPLARDADGAGYTLAATVDDVLAGVTEVVRGDDLLCATPAQILVARALFGDAARVSYCHVPLVVGADGRRLAKRHGDTRIASYRAAGVRPQAIIGRLAASCGWCGAGEEASLAELLPHFSLDLMPRRPCVLENFFTQKADNVL